MPSAVAVQEAKPPYQSLSLNYIGHDELEAGFNITLH